MRVAALACAAILMAAGVVLSTGAMAQTVEPNIPVLVPITGPLALEGTSQRNGALLAPIKGAPLEELNVANTKVYDINLLKGTPLRWRPCSISYSTFRSPISSPGRAPNVDCATTFLIPDPCNARSRFATV